MGSCGGDGLPFAGKPVFRFFGISVFQEGRALLGPQAFAFPRPHPREDRLSGSPAQGWEPNFELSHIWTFPEAQLIPIWTKFQAKWNQSPRVDCRDGGDAADFPDATRSQAPVDSGEGSVCNGDAPGGKDQLSPPIPRGSRYSTAAASRIPARLPVFRCFRFSEKSCFAPVSARPLRKTAFRAQLCLPETPIPASSTA